MQKTFGRDLNLEVGYLGSKNTHLGLPESNLNQLPAGDLALGAALLTKVPNPYFGEIPASSSLGAPTIAQQQLLRAFPRFTNVALFRDNVGDSEYEAVAGEAGETPFARIDVHARIYVFKTDRRCVDLLFADDLYGSDADQYRRGGRFQPETGTGCLERRYSHVFSAGWVYQIPRWRKISGWEIGGLVRVQSGDAVPVSQATNNNVGVWVCAAAAEPRGRSECVCEPQRVEVV